MNRPDPRAAAIARDLARDGFSLPHRALPATEAPAVLAEIEAGRARLSELPDLQAVYGLMKPHLLFDWAERLARRPEVLKLAAAALGPDLLLWSTDLFALRPEGAAARGSAAGGDGFDWHQDSTYMQLDPIDGALRIWVALTPATRANGTLRYLRASHRLGNLPHRLAPGADAARGERVALKIDPAAVVHAELDPGQCTLHDLRIVHSSGSNASGETRTAVALTYVAPAVRPTRPDSALLVAGQDRHGHFRAEPAPGDRPLAARLAAYGEAMTLRMEALAGAAGEGGEP